MLSMTRFPVCLVAALAAAFVFAACSGGDGTTDLPPTDEGSGTATILITGQLDSILGVVLDSTLPATSRFLLGGDPVHASLFVSTEMDADPSFAIMVFCGCFLNKGEFPVATDTSRGLMMTLLPGSNGNRLYAFSPTAGTATIDSRTDRRRMGTLSADLEGGVLSFLDPDGPDSPVFRIHLEVTFDARRGL